MISSVLSHLEEPKQGSSFIWMAILPACPSRLATRRVAAVNEFSGPQSALGSPLMGNKVKYHFPHG